MPGSGDRQPGRRSARRPPAAASPEVRGEAVPRTQSRARRRGRAGRARPAAAGRVPTRRPAALDRRRTYQAAFRDASGLAPGNEVRVAGVKVGKVTDVELARARRQPVRAGRLPGRRRRRPARHARPARRSGSRRCWARSTSRWTPAGPGRLRRGAEIPLERTASPFDVVQAVTGLADTLDQIDTEQLAAAFGMLSQTFADTPRQREGARWPGCPGCPRPSPAATPQLRELLARARGVTGVLAQRDEEFRKLVADGNLLLTEVQPAPGRHPRPAGRHRPAGHPALRAGRRQPGPAGAGAAPAARRGRHAAAQPGQPGEDHANGWRRSSTAFTNVVGNGRWFDSYVDGLLQPYQPTTGGR